MKRPHRSIPIRLASRIHSLIFPPLVNIHYNGLDAPNATQSRSLPDILVKGQMTCRPWGGVACVTLSFLSRRIDGVETCAVSRELCVVDELVRSGVALTRRYILLG